MKFDPSNFVILIVDDVPENISLLAKRLNQEGYRIVAADRPSEALKMVQEKRIDLILLDIMMPEMDGYELCSKIKASQASCDIPIIFLTARSAVEDLVKGFECGAVDYISKPFSAEEISVRVKNQLKLKQYENKLKCLAAENKHLLHLLCHDLSNPFTILVSMLEVIEDFGDREQFRQLAEIFNKVAYNGLDIINLVRRMQALEDGKMELEKVDLKKLVEEAIFHINHKISKKGISIDVNVKNDTYVYGEPVSFLNSVLNNIFTNAIKFSTEFSTINVTSEKDDHEHVSLKITDNGVGMNEKLRSHLFDLHTPTSRTGTLGEEGTGFGMSLVKKFINSYGGEIDVESRPIEEFPNDHGTTVKILLKSYD